MLVMNMTTCQDSMRPKLSKIGQELLEEDAMSLSEVRSVSDVAPNAYNPENQQKEQNLPSNGAQPEYYELPNAILPINSP